MKKIMREHKEDIKLATNIIELLVDRNRTTWNNDNM